MMRLRRTDDSSGFTLVELVVVMTLSLMFSSLVMVFAIDFWRSTATLENDSETFVTRENAGDVLRETLNTASSLFTQNSIADSHTSNADPGDASGTHWLVIHAIPGTTSMPTSGARSLIYFSSPSVNSSKQFIMNGTQPYQDEFILYLDGSTKQLLLRSLANPGASGNRIKTSCPAALASTSCPADRVIANDISAVDTRYFSRSGNLLDYRSITDPGTGAYIGPDFPSVEVVELTLHLQRKSIVHGGNDTSNATIVRVALRNG